MQSVDLAVIVAYFIFILGVGFLFRKQVTNVSEYFRGGGKLLWWMSGASVFMTTFSAWTFTGAAGKAYTDGLPILVIFFGNMISYFVCARFLAGRFRQMRVDTPLEAYRLRYGRFNEQFNLWITFVANLLPGGITLIAISIFVSAIFGWDLQQTILITGAVVLVVTLTGGAWAVIASDFVQAILVIAITIIVGIKAIMVMGGVAPILDQFPADNIMVGSDVNYLFVYFLWVIATLIQRLHDVNNLNASVRFLTVKDSRHARKAAIFSGCLFAGASVIWFLPPMVSAIMFPDLSQLYPGLNNPEEAAYLAFVQHYMPAGMLGLLVAAMFAATMSSMDSSLNGGAAMVTKCFYKPILRPSASEKELLRAGRVITLVLGVVQIFIAMTISRIEGVSLFNLMLSFLGLFGLPVIIPGIMSFFIRRTSDWSAWSTVIFGFGISWLAANVFNGAWVADQFGLDLTAREIGDMGLVTTYGLHLVFTVGWFLLTLLFRQPLSAVRQQEVDLFYNNFDTPVVSTSDAGASDIMQRRRLGYITAAFGAFVLALTFASSGDGRLFAFIGCAAILLAIGGGLIRSAHISATHAEDPMALEPKK